MNDVQQDQINPFRLQNLIKLYIRPKLFFSQSTNYPQWSMWFAAYLLGIASILDRIDQKILKTGDEGISNEFLIQLVSSWKFYWSVVCVLAILSAAIAWLFLGWWFRKRLELCGVVDADHVLARHLMVLGKLVWTLPVFICAMIDTLIYPDYLTAYNQSITGFIIIFCIFWGCWVNYCGATTVFKANKSARAWFLGLPIAFYSLAFIAMVFVAFLLVCKRYDLGVSYIYKFYVI